MSSSSEAPANVRVLVRVRPLSDGEKRGPYGPTTNSAGILSLDNGGRPASTPMDFGSGSETTNASSHGSSATVTINEGAGGGGGGGGGGYGSGYGSGYDSDFVGSSSSSSGKQYQFDAVLGPHSTQADVFGSVRGIVEAVASGYNGTIVAYGQTGSGKTHTVFGNGGCDSDSAGLVQRSLKALFRNIAISQAEGATGVVSAADGDSLLDTSLEGDAADMIRETTSVVSFYEIFNEKVFDLLSSGSSLETALSVREDASRGVYVDGLQEVEVKNTEDAEAILARGTANRQVASTSMNRTSSRSHAVFVLTVRTVLSNPEGLKKVRTSKFTLVDLAGSERQRSTNATGERLKEASSINSSLLTLGNVINALVDRENGRDSRHVPFRDSKITYLLRDSLGGNSKTCLVATVSPAAASASETASTLKFAQRAKQIKNTAVLNEDTCGTVAALRAEVARLRSQLEDTSRSSTDTGSNDTQSSSLFGRPPLPSTSATTTTTSSTGTSCSGSDENALAVINERRARRAEDKASSLQNQLHKKEEVVKSLKRKLQEQQMVQKFKQRRLDYLSKKTTDGVGNNNGPNAEVAALLGEIDALRKQLDRPSPELIEMKVQYERVKEELEDKSNEAGPSRFGDIERESLENLVNSLTDEKRALENKLADVSKSSTETQKEIDVILEEVGRLEAEMEAQKDELKKKEEEIWLATESGASAEAKNDELESKISKTTEELAQAKAEIDSLSESTEDLKQTIEQLRAEVEEKKTSLQEMEAANAQSQQELQNKLDALNAMLEESKDASNDKATAEMEVREQLAAASKDNSLLVQRVTDAASELEKQKAMLEESEARVEKIQHEKEEAVEEAQQRLNDLTASHETKIQELEAEQNRLSEELQAKGSSEEVAAGEIADLKASLEEVESRLEQVQTEKEVAVADMTTKLEEQEAALQTKIQSIEDEKKQVEQQLELLEKTSTCNEAAAEATSAMEIARHAQNETVTKLEETITTLQDEKAAESTSHKAAIEEMQVQLTNLESEKEAACSELENVKAEYDAKILALEEEKQQLSDTLSSLQNDVTTAATAAVTASSEAAAELEKMRVSASEMQSTIDQLEEEKEALRKEIDAAVTSKDEEIQSAKEEAEDAAQKVEELEKEKAELSQKLFALETTIEESQASADATSLKTSQELDEISSKISELQDKVSEKEAALGSAEDKLQALEESKAKEVEELTSQVEAAEAQQATAVEEMTKAQTEASDNENTLKKVQAEQLTLSEQAKLWEQAADDAKKQVKVLKDEIKIMNKKSNSLEFQLESLSEDQDTLNDHVRDLQDRNDELEAENERLRLLIEEGNVPMKDNEEDVAVPDSSSASASPSLPAVNPNAATSPMLEQQQQQQQMQLPPQQQCEDDATMTSPFRDLTSRMDDVITRVARMSEVKAPAPIASAGDDFDDDDSFDESMFLPNASTSNSANDGASSPLKAPAKDQNVPSEDPADNDNNPGTPPKSPERRPGTGKENAGTPFRAKSTGKKRPLSAFKNPNTPAQGSNTKALRKLYQTDVKAPATSQPFTKGTTPMSTTRKVKRFPTVTTPYLSNRK